MLKFNFDIINKARIRITLKDMNNVDDIEKRLLEAGAIIPACPIGQCVYRYDPVYHRVLRFVVAEIRVSSESCVYDLECYENGEIITYQTLEEIDFGTRFFLSRSAAKKNTNMLNDYEAAIIRKSIEENMKEKLILIHKVSGEAYFQVIETNKLLSLRMGLRLLASKDTSEDFIELLNKKKNEV
jgi:hypothetical protein